MNQGELTSEAAFEIAQAMLSTLDPDAALATLVGRMRGLGGTVRACSVFEYDEQAALLRVRCSDGLTEEFSRTVIRSGTTAVGKAFERADVVLVGDIDADPIYTPYLQTMHDQNLESVLAVPLVARQSLVGILCLYFGQHVAPTEYNVDAVRTLANLAALAIDNARMFQTQARAAHELQELYARLSEQAKVLERALKAHDWLVNTVLVRHGLEAVTAALADLADATVVLEDRHLNILCISRGAGAPAGCEEADLPLRRYADHPQVREHLARVTAKRRPEALPTLPSVGCSVPRIVAPVFAGETLLGFLSLLPSAREFGKLDYLMVEQGAVAVALEMMKASVAFGAEQKVRADLLHSLLQGRLDELDQAQAAVAAGHFNLQTLRNVLRVRIDRPEEIDGSLGADGGPDPIRQRVHHLVEAAVLQAAPDSFVVAEKEGIVVLLGGGNGLAEADARTIATSLVAKVAEGLAPFTLSVGVGSACAHFRDLARSYEEAGKALRVGVALGRRGAVIAFGELGVYGILLRQNDPSELREFAQRHLEPLRTYDGRHTGELVKTLRAYVRNNFRLEDTARELYLHPHSVLYRLRRIEELCGLSLRDSEGLLCLHLALRLDELLE